MCASYTNPKAILRGLFPCVTLMCPYQLIQELKQGICCELLLFVLSLSTYQGIETRNTLWAITIFRGRKTRKFIFFWYTKQFLQSDLLHHHLYCVMKTKTLTSHLSSCLGRDRYCISLGVLISNKHEAMHCAGDHKSRDEEEIWENLHKSS